MNNKITNLYRYLDERQSILQNGHIEMENLQHLIERNKQNLHNFLNEEGKQILEKYDDCIDEYLTLMKERSFGDGLTIGIKISAQALLEKE